MRRTVPALFVCFAAACSSGASQPFATAGTDAAGADSGQVDSAIAIADGSGAGQDARTTPECEWGGAPGTCMAASACAAIADHSAEPGSCATGLACCIDTPDIADDPPTPAGYKLMMQSQVTAAMTAWAVMILHDPVTYPMYATTTQVFGTLTVLALVEWHPPDFQNGVVHRGVTLFVPL
jgi:hypothetical protein